MLKGIKFQVKGYGPSCIVWSSSFGLRQGIFCHAQNDTRHPLGNQDVFYQLVFASTHDFEAGRYHL